MKLKEKMGVVNILKREHEQLEYIFERLSSHPEISILAGEHTDRLGVISFTVGDCHHDLAVKILNDRFGIQSRGGCSCAGTYGHYLLEIDEQSSDDIIQKVMEGNYALKPGWVRVSIHPTTTNAEIEFVCDSIIALAENYKTWKEDYIEKNFKYIHCTETDAVTSGLSQSWFEF